MQKKKLKSIPIKSLNRKGNYNKSHLHIIIFDIAINHLLLFELIR